MREPITVTIVEQDSPEEIAKRALEMLGGAGEIILNFLGLPVSLKTVGRVVVIARKSDGNIQRIFVGDTNSIYDSLRDYFREILEKLNKANDNEIRPG